MQNGKRFSEHWGFLNCIAYKDAAFAVKIACVTGFPWLCYTPYPYMIIYALIRFQL